MQISFAKKHLFFLTVMTFCMSSYPICAEEGASTPPAVTAPAMNTPTPKNKVDTIPAHPGQPDMSGAMKHYIDSLPPEARDRYNAAHAAQNDDAPPPAQPETPNAPLSHDIGR